jgi:hypothetical protein
MRGGRKIPSPGKKSGSKTPRFFCESCGAEVPMNAKSCPGCGKFFASVRCPACGFVGEEGLFHGGCPVCGYSASPDGKRISWPGKEGKESAGFAGSLPLWVYIIAVLALLIVLAAIFFRFL